MSSPTSITIPSPNTTLHTNEDNSYLQSISDSTIFLHDGVLRSINLKSLKEFEQSAKYHDALTISSTNQIEELIAITSSNVEELSRKIIKLSTLHVQGIGLHHRYQWNVLERVWQHQRSKAMEKAEKDNVNLQQSEVGENESGSDSGGEGNKGLGFKLTLCLLVPMLETYANQNMEVALSVMQLIFEELSSVPAMSLNQDNSGSLEKLEVLLGRWAANKDAVFQVPGPSAMVAFACARGVLSSLGKTALMLESLNKPHLKLPVANMLRKLNDVRIKIGKPIAIISDKHVTTFPYDDRLLADSIALEVQLGVKSHPLLTFQPDRVQPNLTAAAAHENRPESSVLAAGGGVVNAQTIRQIVAAAAAAEARTNKLAGPDEVHGHSVATNGHFLFVTGPEGKGLTKLGTGLRGTLQGWVYHNNIELNCGLLTYADGLLISRPLELDSYDETVEDNKIVFGVTINTATLKPDKLVLMERTEDFAKPIMSLGMTSDGSSIFFIRTTEPPLTSPPAENKTGLPSPQMNVWMDVLRIEDNPDSSHVYLVPKALKVPLVRQDDSTESDKSSADGRAAARRARSVRITSGGAPPPPPPPNNQFASSSAQSNGYECINTSLNVNLKQLVTGIYFTCGSYLTILVSNNSQLYIANSIGPSSGVSPTMRQYAPVLSPSCPKSIGVQIHVCISGGGNSSPTFTKQDFLSLTPDSSFFHGAVIPEVGATYDHTNNLIWTVNGLFVDCWRNPGHIPLWKQNQIMLLKSDDVPEGTSNVEVKTVIDVMLRHGGIMAHHFLMGDRLDANIGFNGNVLKILIDLLYKYKQNFEGPELISVFLTLQAIVSQVKSVEQDSEVYKDLYNVQVMILCFLNDIVSTQKFSSTIAVYKEACKFFAMAFDFLYTNAKSRNDFFLELYDYLEQNGEEESSIRGSLMMLEDSVLQHFTDSLNNPMTKFEEGLKWVVDAPWLMKIIHSSNEEIRTMLLKIAEKDFAISEVICLTSSLPIVSVSTAYVNAVVNFFLRCLTIHHHPNEFPRGVADIAVEIFREVLKAGPPLVETCVESVSTATQVNLAVYNCSEAILKSSILAHGIPQILVFLSLDAPSMRPLLDDLTEECIQLTVAFSFLANKLNPSTSEDLPGPDDWSSSVKLLSPWNTKRSYESAHPVREGNKLKESIIVPDARQLYIKIHPQSATQYDYDRLAIFSGVVSSAMKKVGDFGGNYYGYGNRYFSGPGWARSLVKIDGNSMTYNFEMKSGREHSVPDKALWGFQFTVFPILDYSDAMKPARGEDDTESVIPVTPGFITLTALHCIDVIQNVSKALLQGYNPTRDEKNCGILLENRLVAGLKWPSRPVGTSDPPKRFSADLMAKLKRAAGVSPLQMRLSIIEKIRVSDLEELYLQCCMEHIGINPYLTLDMLLSGSESTWGAEPTRDILREIFHNIDTMFRKMMAFYEMEKMFCQEIEEISNHTKDISEAFFSDSAFLESPSDLQTLAWICYLEYDKESPRNLINDVIAMVDALSADGSAPQLTRTDELIEETYTKCKFLLAAVPNHLIGPVYHSPKLISGRLHDIHGFITAHMYCPNASVNSFLEASRSRRERAVDRIKGLDILHKVLESSCPSYALLVVTAILLQSGPRLQNIICSGLEKEVINIFGEVMKTAVGIAEKNPLLHRYTIALLSVTAYDQTDEENLVESGLVGLLDQLCAFQTGHLTPYRRTSPVEHTSERKVTTSVGVAQAHNKASTLAWAAFQVLAGQCASWESSKKDFYIDDVSEWNEPEHRELPLQISVNVTNHLARAAALAALSSSNNQLDLSSDRISCSPNLTVAIQDVIDLLNNLRTYRIGRAILKQSPCVCRLLGLLQDSRLSPRLVLTILKLLHTALPLVDDLDTANFKQIVPSGKSFGNGGGTGMGSFWTIIDSTPYTQVASMLLTKLADYLVCGSSQSSKSEDRINRPTCNSSSQGQMTGLTDPKFEKMEVWVQKGSDGSTGSLIRQLFLDTSRQDLKPSRATMADLENELNVNGKVMLYTEESSEAERKALRISQLGHFVTLVPVGFSKSPVHTGLAGQHTREAMDILCKDRNSHLSSWDPARPFLSGHVAENLASEIVQLIRALLSSSEWGKDRKDSRSRLSGTNVSSSTTSISTVSSTNASHLAQKSMWPGAVEQVICAALKLLPRLASVSNPSTTHIESYVYSARMVIAALTVLGGFTETIRSGLEVWIIDEKKQTLMEGSNEDPNAFLEEWEFKAVKGRVISLSESSPTARVEIPRGNNNVAAAAAADDILTVPLCRLIPAHFRTNGAPNLPSLSRFAQIEIAGYLKSLLISNAAADCPMKRSLPTLNQIVLNSSSQVSETRAIAQAMTIVRLLAEIRTKAMQVLSLWLTRKEFSDIFLGAGSESQFSKKFSSDVLDVSDNLKELSKQCVPSHKAASLEGQVAWMRLLYRDCTKPPRLPITTAERPSAPDGMRWDVGRTFPKIKSTVLSSASNTLVYTGDYNVSGGNPRGLVLFGNSVIPAGTGFYWEATIVSMEEPGQHADLIVVPPLSIGFSPVPSNMTNDVWKYPSGTVMYTTLGRVIHYKTQDAGSWVTVRLNDDFRVKTGDTIGIGWERSQGPAGPGPSQRPRIIRNQPISHENTPRRVRNRSSNPATTNNASNNSSGLGARGVVYFTLNGRRLPSSVEQSNCGLHPILHIQKKQMVVHTNLGEKPFLYVDASKISRALNAGEQQQQQQQSSGSSNNQEDVLLRRVSDSLQDLNLVFNINLSDFESEPELNLQDGGVSSSTTVSDVSNRSTNRDEDWDAELENDDEDSDDDDDDDSTEAVSSEPTIPRGGGGEVDRRNRIPLRALPPTPAPAVSVSGSNITVNRPPPPPPPPRPPTARPNSGRRERLLAKPVNSVTSLESSGQAGSTRKNEMVAKPRQKFSEYNPVKSLEYFMVSSPTAGIRVFHGPRRYTCPCAVHCPTPLDFLLLKIENNNEKTLADMESLDGYEDDEDDIHSLLVKAWESQVFPTIRRRFRNESERRDGLEQIRGALQLGMLDIARQTVEFLYEEGGGLPRDLHFPTLEEVRAEAARCTMDKLKAGMSVIIRPLQDIPDVTNVIPNYAVGAMLRTFGLVGEVLEVDTLNDLILVETYIESEGVLVRFWYPVSCLDKSPTNKKPTLSSNSVNMFKLHSHLISMESSLCHMYSRNSYLSIAHQCNKNMISSDESLSEEKASGSVRISPIVSQIFHDFDLDSLQILSDYFLSNYPPTRDLFTYNIQCESPSQEFLLDSCNPSLLFYKHNHKCLVNCIRNKIRDACKSGEDGIDELTGKLLLVLELPDKFPYQEVQLDKIVDLEVSLPGAAFTLASFKGSQNHKQMLAVDNTVHPCLHLSSYDSSDVSRNLMACYPLEPLHVVVHRASTPEGGQGVISHTAPTTTSANLAMNKTTRKRHNRFPPVLCPTDRVYCSISEISLPDVVMDIQGIPKEFPLALLYIQELVNEFHRDSSSFTFSNITNVFTRLLVFLEQLQLPPVIKDWTFTLISELSRIKKDDTFWRPSPQERVSRSCTPNRFLMELLLLRDKEAEQTLPTHISPIVNALTDQLEASGSSSSSPPPSKNYSKGKSVAPATLMDHISTFISSHQKSPKSVTEPLFSFYFTSLNDLCLALNEVSEIMVNPYEIIPLSIHSSTDPSPQSTPARRPSSTITASADSLVNLSTGPPAVVQLPNRRTIPKVIRKRAHNGSKLLKDKTGSSPPLDKPNAKPLQSTSSEDGLLAFAKSSEIEWFHNQVVITRVLRDISWHSPNDGNSREAAQDLIGAVLERLKTTSPAHNRLLVIQGAPVNIDGMSIEASLIRALSAYGGLNEMWISENSAVVEIRCLAKVNEAYEILKQNKVWYPLEDYVLYPNVNVYRVNENLKVMESQGDQILNRFLKTKISDPEMNDKLSAKAIETLTSIYMSCYSTCIPFVVEEDSDSEPEGSSGKTRVIILTEHQMTLKNPGNLLELFLGGVKGEESEDNFLKNVLNRFGEKRSSVKAQLPKIPSNLEHEIECKTDGESVEHGECALHTEQSASHERQETLDQQMPDISLLNKLKSLNENGLSLSGFLKWCTELLKSQTNLLWKGIFAAGYDIRFDRTWPTQDPTHIYSYFHSESWALEKDAALISYMDAFSQSLHIDPTRIQAHELLLTESDFLSMDFTTLQGIEIPYLRVRWGMLQKLNTLLSKKLLAHASLHTLKSTQKSLAKLLHDSRQLMLYYTKEAYLYKIINISAFRGSDTPTPEITLDPLSSIGNSDEKAFKNQLGHIIQQMATITTAFYCVPHAQGADPALPLSIKFQGEEVLGLTGSFRHFLLNASKELQHESIKLLCKCPSADAGKNKDNFIITPGKLSYGEEDFLYFLGQMIGISMRSDAPLALPLLRATWRSLLFSERESNDSSDDLAEADILSSTYLKKLESFTTKMAFDNFLSLNAWPKFQYPSMDNTSLVPLCADGSTVSLSFTNRDQFIRLIKQLREKELLSTNKVTKILTGVATILPIPAILGLFTSNHLELRIAGSPQVNLSLLKSHTHYQVGISENDPHINFFWSALESFSGEERRKFIKFAANLERLPATCPCQSLEQTESTSSTIHVPPFPMKIAPIDIPSSATLEEIDKRLIRVETCLFLIRLPPYSSLQVTRQQLLFAINCREDPLSG